MQLFEILQDGFHTPLTEAQISELFQAGRLNRHTRCKPAKQGQWRTIDELFPLLKYHAPWQFASGSPETSNEFRFRRAIVVGVGLATAAAAAVVVYFYLQGQSPSDRRVTAIDYIPSSKSQSPASRPLLSAQPIQNSISPSTTGSFSNAITNQVVVPAEEGDRPPFDSHHAPENGLEWGKEVQVAEVQAVVLLVPPSPHQGAAVGGVRYPQRHRGRADPR